MDNQNLYVNGLSEFDKAGLNFQNQYLQDLSIIHEQFVDLWFKNISYFEWSCSDKTYPRIPLGVHPHPQVDFLGFYLKNKMLDKII